MLSSDCGYLGRALTAKRNFRQINSFLIWDVQVVFMTSSVGLWLWQTMMSMIGSQDKPSLVFAFGHKWQKWDVSVMSSYQSSSLGISCPLLVFLPCPRPPFTFIIVPLAGRWGREGRGFEGRFVIDLCSVHWSCLTCGAVGFPFYTHLLLLPRVHTSRPYLWLAETPGLSVFTSVKRREKHVLHGEMCPAGGPHPAALGLGLHHLQHTALLSRWETIERQWWGLPAGLAHGGAHRRGPLCKYKPIIHEQIQKSEGLLFMLV